MRGIVRRNLINLCFTNFKTFIPISSSTLYQYEQEEEEDEKSNYFPTTAVNYSSDDFEPPVAAIDDPDDLASSVVFSSERFFFSYPGQSSSIMDSSFSSSILPPPTSNSGFTSSIVSTFSDHPYMDFRRSMEEMVVAENLFDVTSNWEYLHELLLCYLVLNSKHTHNFIVRAFSDLLATLTYNAGQSS